MRDWYAGSARLQGSTALQKAGAPVELATYPEEGHEFSNAAAAEAHFNSAMRFFKSVPAVSTGR